MRTSIILLIVLVGSLIALTSADPTERRIRKNLAGEDTIKYTVQFGDTLPKIAKKYGIDWEPLAKSNNLEKPDFIHIGQVLTIPMKNSGIESTGMTMTVRTSTDKVSNESSVASTYTVKSGHSLSKIGHKYGKYRHSLAKANNIANPEFIHLGQVITIP